VTAAEKAKDESAELCELRRRNKLLEQDNEILRRSTVYSPGTRS
jgi:transposase